MGPGPAQPHPQHARRTEPRRGKLQVKPVPTHLRHMPRAELPRSRTQEAASGHHAGQRGPPAQPYSAQANAGALELHESITGRRLVVILRPCGLHPSSPPARQTCVCTQNVGTTLRCGPPTEVDMAPTTDSPPPQASSPHTPQEKRCGRRTHHTRLCRGEQSSQGPAPRLQHSPQTEPQRGK